MPETKITVSKNGPYLVQGGCTIVGSDGGTIQDADGNVALCRCGASENKPFCDGTHSKIGFESEVTAD